MYKLLCLRALFFIHSFAAAACFFYKSKKDIILLKRTFNQVVEECENKNICFFHSVSSQKQEYSLENLKAFSLVKQSISIKPPSLQEYLKLVLPYKRPDILEGSLYIKFLEEGNFIPIAKGLKLFLQYKTSNKYLNSAVSEDYFNEVGIVDPHKDFFSDVTYYFSPQNEPTSFWLEIEDISSNQREVRLRTCLQTKDDVILYSDSFNILTSKVIEECFLDNLRLDSSLLMKQQAVWHGKDLFLDLYGGEEFISLIEKERISFVDSKGQTYSCYLKLGDYLVWKEGQWRVPQPLENSQDLPILVVKKIEEKFVGLELIGPFGLTNFNLNLIKYPILNDECAVFYRELSYVGLKNWDEVILQSDTGERIVLSEGDWLCRYPEGWKVLDSLKEVDDYISGAISAPLFVFQKIQKRGGSYLLKGTLFNSSRTYFEEVELSLHQDFERTSSMDIIQSRKNM